MLTQDDEALLAKALYDELDGDERGRVDALLAQDVELAEEFAAMRGMVERIPAERPDYLPDLSRSVMASLDKRRHTWWPMAAAAALVLSVVVGLGVVRNTPVDAPAPVVASEVEQLFASVEAQREIRDYASAYRLLEGRLADLSPDEQAQAVQRMAEVAYEDLQWYPEAMKRYRELRTEYFAAFQADHDNIYRLSVLEESAGTNQDFAPLVALASASESESLPELEQVMTRYPGSVVAKLAAAEASRVAAKGYGLDGTATSRLAALERALDESKHPVVRAHLQLAAADLAHDELSDEERARPLYLAVLRSGVPGLETQARTALAALDADSAP